ncbi:hypothetical protein [Psychroserpens luteus]|uniref:Uncharacterized protein n=1 Tax=Psychroserpens luteus TaxID=1434066 RepID=A0ABW5ZP52_9FLAO|nr:hypothetical protein [Psychroserpens luteus]
MSYGQFQISGSSGFALGSAQMKLEETINIFDTENDYGSHFKSSAKKDSSNMTLIEIIRKNTDHSFKNGL